MSINPEAQQQLFNNRYRLDDKLGEGGMAVVYCGTDTLLRRRVAVKVLREQYAADAEFVRRFYQEAESAARLSHPNIVNTYDVGREGALYYIVMELVDGPSLAEIIAHDGKLPEPVAIDYAAQICNGLAYAHRQGLLHRDVKPANILVTKDDVCKLSDFGIARAVSQQTMTMTKPGLVMGSVYYISPEQAQGHDLHETADLYSVGVVLYQMLTGALPFTGDSPVTVALKHIGNPVPSLDAKALGVSPALAAIVNKLLQKRPENRFQSASDVASALREARERPSIAAFPPSNDAPSMGDGGAELPPRRSPMPDRRSTATEGEDRRSKFSLGSLVTLVVLLALAIGAGFYVFGRPLPIPNLTTTIPVADYTAMTDAAAQQAVVNAGLVARIVKSPSNTVPLNHVIRQNPAAGAKVEKNSIVELIVSNGKPLVGLPDVRGYSVSDAQRTLAIDDFKVAVRRVFDSSAKDNVISQRPKAGSKVAAKATILLTVSNGPRPVDVPNFVGMNVDDAQALAQKIGATLDESQRQPVAGVAADTIASQSIAPGNHIDHTTVIRALVSTGNPNAAPATLVSLPNVVGSPYKSAIAALTGAGFRVRLTFTIQPESTANGTITTQEPAPNTQVAQGSTVAATLSVPGEVPDTEGETISAARDTLQAAGYTIGQMKYTSYEGSDGNVVRTEPDVGTTLAPGSSVMLIVNGT